MSLVRFSTLVASLATSTAYRLGWQLSSLIYRSHSWVPDSSHPSNPMRKILLTSPVSSLRHISVGRCLSWDDVRAQLIVSMNYAQITCCLTHTKGLAAVRSLALTYMFLLGSLVEELVDVVYLFLRQRPLPDHAILGDRFHFNLAPYTCIYRWAVRHFCSKANTVLPQNFV